MIHYPTRKDLIASFAKDTVGVEVGVQAGIFSQEILDCGVKHLHLVDPWEHQTGEYEKDPANIDQGGQDALFRSVTEKFKDNRRVTIHRKYSREKLYCYKENSPSWVYLDGDHREVEVYKDLMYWAHVPGITKILGHDYTNSYHAQWMGFGVFEAVNNFCKYNNWEMKAVVNEEWPSYMLERK